MDRPRYGTGIWKEKKRIPKYHQQACLPCIEVPKIKVVLSIIQFLHSINKIFFPFLKGRLSRISAKSLSCAKFVQPLSKRKILLIKMVKRIASTFFTKGQIIPKIPKGFLMSYFLQKTNEGILLYYYDTLSRLVFIRFLEETDDPNKPFRN